MNCTEVIELIQIDLDGKLEEFEQVLLKDHLHSCWRCQMEAIRMGNVSEQLEHLPKVAPAYSVVDKILPILDIIDQADKLHEKEKSTLSEQVHHVQQKLNEQTKKRTYFIKNVWLLPGVALAAGFLVFIVMSYQQLSNQVVTMNQENLPKIAMNYGTINEDATDKSLALNQPPQEEEKVADQDQSVYPAKHVHVHHHVAETPSTTKEETTKKNVVAANPNIPKSTAPAEERMTNLNVINEKENLGDKPKEDKEKLEEVRPEPLPVVIGNPNNMPSFAPKVYTSPDGTYTAFISYGQEERIRINKEGQFYWESLKPWTSPWGVDYVEWVSLSEVYYILLNIESGEKMYRLIQLNGGAEEKVLEGPYQKVKQ